jgi:uncharacterized membrane protein YphA (DoxX/SURF4 family)
MLNPFPELLALGFFAPTILRIAAGAMFLYAARHHWEHREQIGSLHFPVVGRGNWIAWAAILFHFVIGLMLIFGYYTQYAAVLAAVGAFKGILLGKSYPDAFMFSRSTYVLLVILSLSLLITGAGAFAFDLPL